MAALVTERPAAVLLDINLLDSSGLDLLREIKRRSPKVIVIMITAETLYENKEHAEIPVLVEHSRIAAAPLTGVLPKYRAMPCSQNELIRLARRRLTSISGHGRAKGLL